MDLRLDMKTGPPHAETSRDVNGKECKERVKQIQEAKLNTNNLFEIDRGRVESSVSLCPSHSSLLQLAPGLQQL